MTKIKLVQSTAVRLSGLLCVALFACTSLTATSVAGGAPDQMSSQQEGLHQGLVGSQWYVSSNENDSRSLSGCRTTHGNRRAKLEQIPRYLQCMAAQYSLRSITPDESLRDSAGYPRQGDADLFLINLGR